MEKNEFDNIAIQAENNHKTAVEESYDYIENFDILETITNVGNDEVFTPRKTCERRLDSLPQEVWSNPNYKWLNPATKNGIFEREIAIRLDGGLKEIIPDQEKRRKHILQNRIFAIGQTKFTANIARRTLYYCSQANRKCDGIKAADGHYVNGYAIGNGSWFQDEEGNIKTPIAEHCYKKNSKSRPDDCPAEERKQFHCKYCGINGASNYNDKNQLEKYAYEFIHVDSNKILEHLQDRFFKGDRTMKFDIVIGNPPYQLDDGGAQSSSIPIYQLFVEQSIALQPKYIGLIMPSRWMTGGKGLDDFRYEFIHDKHIKILNDFKNEKECFPNNEIKGGVCFFLWDKDYVGKCDIITHSPDGVDKTKRYLKEDGCDIYIRDKILISIRKKAGSLKEDTFNTIVSARKPYGLEAETMVIPEKFGLSAFSTTKIDDGYEILGLNEKMKRVWKFLPVNYRLPKKSSCIDKYKIFIAEAYGSGKMSDIPSSLVIAKPKQICTETFLEIGPFDTENEAQNSAKYMKTKFFRVLVGIQKQTQHSTAKAYRFVPLQNFKDNSEIDWSLSISEINQSLYKKYQLSDDEISYIEKYIKEMD